MKTLTQEKLKEHVFYNPMTGEWVRKIATTNRVKEGEVIHNFSKAGLMIIIDKERYPASRLAFLYMLGEFPKGYVKHVNGNTLDYRWSNLTVKEPKQKIPAPSYSNTGVLGLSYHRRSKKYQCRIMKNRTIYPASFENKEEAINWLANKRKSLELEAVG